MKIYFTFFFYYILLPHPHCEHCEALHPLNMKFSMHDLLLCGATLRPGSFFLIVFDTEARNGAIIFHEITKDRVCLDGEERISKAVGVLNNVLPKIIV